MGYLRNYLENIFREAKARNDELLVSMLDKGIQTFLDLGCSDGTLTRRIADSISALEVMGIEIDPELASQASRIGIAVTVGDLNRGIPLGDELADAISANQLIEHVHDTDNLLREALRMLKPGGCIVIATENLSSWHNIFALVLGWQPFSLTNISERTWQVGNPLGLHVGEPAEAKYRQHIRVLSYRGLRDIVSTYGFDVEDIRGAGYFPLGGRLARYLARSDPRHAAFLVLKARKPCRD